MKGVNRDPILFQAGMCVCVETRVCQCIRVRKFLVWPGKISCYHTCLLMLDVTFLGIFASAEMETLNTNICESVFIPLLKCVFVSVEVCSSHFFVENSLP